MYWAAVIDQNWRGDIQSPDAIHFIIDGCLPFLDMARRIALLQSQIPLSVSIGPPTIELLSDSVVQSAVRSELQTRVTRLESAWRRTDLARREFIGPELERSRRLAQLYRDFDGRLVEAYAKLHRESGLELLAAPATATHLPSLIGIPGAIRLHFEEAARVFSRAFTFDPRGIHLLRAGFLPSFEPVLAESGFEYVIVDARALDNASAKVIHGVYAPIHTPNCGLTIMAPDQHSQRIPASRSHRFHRLYRDCSRHPRLTLDGLAGSPGISRYGHDDNLPERYDAALAGEAVRNQARAYVSGRKKHADALQKHVNRRPLMVVDFDVTSLADHWQEAPDFIEEVVTLIGETDGMDPITPTGYAALFNENQAVWPGPVIDTTPVDEVADWRLPRLYQCAQSYSRLVEQHRDETSQNDRLGIARNAMLKAFALPSVLSSSYLDWSDQIVRLKSHLKTVMEACHPGDLEAPEPMSDLTDEANTSSDEPSELDPAPIETL